MSTPVIVGQRDGWVTIEGLNDVQEDDLYEYLEVHCGFGKTLTGAVGRPYKLIVLGATLSTLTEKVRKYLTEHAVAHRVL